MLMPTFTVTIAIVFYVRGGDKFIARLTFIICYWDITI